MSFTGAEIEQFVKGKLEIHFRLIEVVQNTKNNPARFIGPGTVSLDNGRLEYVLHHSPGDKANDSRLLLGVEGKAGQVIAADQSYSFSGTDVHGRVWIASETDTYRGVFGQNGIVVKGNLQCLKTEKKSAPIRVPKAHYILAENKFFPRLDFMPEGGIEFVVDGKQVKANVDEFVCDLNVYGRGVDEKSSRAILKILEMLSGSILQIRAAEFECSGGRWLELHSMDISLPNSQLPPPIELFVNQPWGLLEDFFSDFYDFFVQDGGKLYDYWFQLNRAWQGGLQAASLTVCIYIEGLLREYFEELGRDGEFHDMASKALPEILKLDVSDRIIELLKGSVGNAGQFKAKTALHHLEKKNAISEGLARHWTKLRNDSAHGVRAGQGYQVQQRQVDLMFNNLKLFYEIMFHLGGYKGSRIDYGTHGFPTRLGDLVV